MDDRKDFKNRTDDPVGRQAADLLTHALFGDAADDGAPDEPVAAIESGAWNDDAQRACRADDPAHDDARHAIEAGAWDDDAQRACRADDPADDDARHAIEVGAWDDDAQRACRAGDPADHADALDAPAHDEKPQRLEQPQPRVEAFVPTDAYRTQPPRRRKRRHRRTRAYVWAALVALGVILLGALGMYAYNVRNNPGSFFGAGARVTPSPALTAVESGIAHIDAAPTAAPTPTPTLDPYAALVAQADTTMMQNIVNILIIGVDYAEERETWSGKKEWHSDVMMVLAVNFDENRADLISLPRDTYAKIPGVKGVYKLNAAINCGGGMDASGGAGFLKVCEAASWMLGGIPVDYYYAVTMPAVKGLVDAVGGVDYELETSFTMMGRRYYKGQQHMDGQAVLDYLRVRKNISKSGDVNRVNRQKRMMVALFESMQQQNLILKIPDIVSSFNGQLFTNCTLSQTAALASFAYDLDKENIGMYSMTSKGGGNTNIFNWNFCLTDQPARVQIIKTVYGIDVPEEKEYTPAYARYRWALMRADRYAETAQKVCDYAASYIAQGSLTADPVWPGGDFVIPAEPAPLPSDGGGASGGITGGVPDAGAVNCRKDLGLTITGRARAGLRLPTPVESYTQLDLDLYNSLRAQLAELPDTRAYAEAQAQKYLAGESSSFASAADSLISAVESLKTTAEQAAANMGYSGSLSWSVRYEKDPSFNEVTVDFD